MRQDRQKPAAPPELYQTALEFCAVHAWVVRRAQDAIAKDGGDVMIRVAGECAKHPALQLIRDHSAQFRQYCTLFGFSQKELRERAGHVGDEEFFKV